MNEVEHAMNELAKADIHGEKATDGRDQRVLTPEEFAIAMAQIKTGVCYDRMYDQEDQHFDADELMCNVLRSLGYDEGVDIFDSMPKWYA